MKEIIIIPLKKTTNEKDYEIKVNIYGCFNGTKTTITTAETTTGSTPSATTAGTTPGSTPSGSTAGTTPGSTPSGSTAGSTPSATTAGTTPGSSPAATTPTPGSILSCFYLIAQLSVN
jgi:hypothetical protein